MLTFDWPAFETWALLDREPQLAPPTLEAYKRQLRFAARDHGLPLEGFTVEAGRQYLARRIRSGTTAYGRYMDAKALNVLAEYLHGEAPFQKPRLPRTSPRFLTHAELQRVLAWRHPHPYTDAWVRAFLFLEFHLGTRISEVARMELGDLDAAKSRVHIRCPAKGGKVRWLRVPRSVWSPQRPLMAYLARRPTPRASPEALWVTRFWRGIVCEPRRLPQAELARVLAEDVTRGVGFTVNCTVARHTVGFRLRRAGWDLLAIKEYLGHQSVKSTEIYANDPEGVERLMELRPPRDFYQVEG